VTIQIRFAINSARGNPRQSQLKERPMKIIISFLATVFLAAMTFAQEESASPAPTTEEKASATVEESPASKPAEATAPAAEKKAEPAKAAAPATAQKKETAATAAKPAASAAAAAPSGKKMSVEASIKDMEEKWEASVPTHDYSKVQGFVAADFVGISSKGKFTNRSSMLAEFKSDKDTYTSAKNEKLNVKTFGPNVAVVTGRAREKGTGKDGKTFDRTYLFTDTWVLRGGQWQCVASQVMKVKG
jgi:ketosteroid isomerase-like protein